MAEKYKVLLARWLAGHEEQCIVSGARLLLSNPYILVHSGYIRFFGTFGSLSAIF
jgi:hypothetical protein